MKKITLLLAVLALVSCQKAAMLFSGEYDEKLSTVIKMIQSINVVPGFSDGSVAVDTAIVEMRFDIHPISSAESLAENWKSSKSGLFLNTLVTTVKSSPIYGNLDICDVEYKDELLYVYVDATGLPDHYIEGQGGMSASLTVSDGTNDVSSPFFSLTFTPKSDWSLLKNTVAVELKDPVFNRGYVSSQGYFCLQNSCSGEETGFSSLSFMEKNTEDQISMIFSKSKLKPTQLITEDGIYYFSFPTDTLMEVIFDDGSAMTLLGKVVYSDGKLSRAASSSDDGRFISILKNASTLFYRTAAEAEHISAEKRALMSKYAEMFKIVAEMSISQDSSEVGAFLKKDSEGSYVFVNDMKKWYSDNTLRVSQTISVWTGSVSYKLGGSSCTLSGTIWCPSNKFNEFGSYGVICDSDISNLFYGKAEYSATGNQPEDSLSYSVDFRGFKPKTTYYYRSYYKFNTSNHGGLVPQYGNETDEILYDETIKSFTTGDNVLSVDVVMCIDITGSMSDIISTVKSNAINFYDQFEKCCTSNGITLSALNAQVIGFRDKNNDAEWMEISDNYSLPSQAAEFKSFVNSFRASGGGDTAESGLEALNNAFGKKDWGKDDGYHRQVVILWTDAPYLIGSYYSDITLETVSKAWSAMPSGRRLVLFAPDGTTTNGGNWRELSTWTNTIFETDLTSGFGDIDYILESIIGELTSKVTTKTTKSSFVTAGFKKN